MEMIFSGKDLSMNPFSMVMQGKWVPLVLEEGRNFWGLERVASSSSTLFMEKSKAITGTSRNLRRIGALGSLGSKIIEI